ncbi:MAG TPA: aminopeptidase N [Euzebyales bacterium]
MSDDNILGRDEAAARARLLGDVAYDVDLDLGDGRGDTFTSATRARFSCSTPGASTFIDLTATRLRSVTLNGVDVPAEAFDGNRLTLRGLAATNELIVHADCAFQRTGTGLHRFVDPTDDAVYLHTQFEPFDAHLVYACFDQPDLKARFRLTVRAPRDWTVISNEPVASREPASHTADDVDIWRFDVTPPLSTYVTAMVAGPLHVVHAPDADVPMALYCRASLAEHLEPDEMFEITRAGMAFYADAFGLAYPFSKYDQLFVPEFNFGAMENAGCVTFSENYLFRSRVTDAARMSRAATILHELAHMWFGDLVTMRWWGDLWLNESFATYISFWALTEATRFTDAWVQFVNQNVTWSFRQDQLPTTHPIVADAPDTDTAIHNFDGITYAKGGLVLRQLVAWVGTDAFLSGLRDYFARHAWGNATLADFLTALEKTSGRSMDRWAQQWLTTTGLTTLELTTTTDRDGRYDDAVLVQHPSTGDDVLPRDMRVAIGRYGSNADDIVRRETIDLDVTTARTPVEALLGRTAADLTLLNDGLRNYVKVRLDDRSLETLLGGMSNIAEPLTRAHAWLLAWDLVRDAHLPARRYVQLVADHAVGETQTDTLRRLTMQAIAAIDRYGDPGNRQAARTVLARASVDALDAAEPGSDLQLVWARCRMAVGDPSWTRTVLDGRDVPDGLVVDHDLRWHAAITLAARGQFGADEIEAVRADDPTDEGSRRAATALAARPLASAKQQAWTRARDRDLPLAMRRSICAGFHRYDQPDLLTPFVDRFVDVLPDLWRNRVRQESLDLTEGLFPLAVASEATLEAAGGALATPGLPEPARRILREQIDELRRTLRARAADRD